MAREPIYLGEMLTNTDPITIIGHPTGTLTPEQSNDFISVALSVGMTRQRFRIMPMPPTEEEIAALVAQKGRLGQRLRILGRLVDGSGMRVPKIQRYLLGFTSSRKVHTILTNVSQMFGVSLEALRRELQETRDFTWRR